MGALMSRRTAPRRRGQTLGVYLATLNLINHHRRRGTQTQITS
jgi:hypothetical protein